jgi:hypothetical protein
MMAFSSLQNVSPEELALIATLLREDVLRGLDGLQALNSTGNMTLGEALINGQRLMGGVPMSPAQSVPWAASGAVLGWICWSWQAHTASNWYLFPASCYCCFFSVYFSRYRVCDFYFFEDKCTWS